MVYSPGKMSAPSLTERLRTGYQNVKQNVDEYAKGTWGNPMVVLATILVTSLIFTLVIWWLHTDIFANGAAFEYNKLGMFASGGGFLFFLVLFLAMAGGSLAMALAVGKNITSVAVAALCFIAIAGLAWGAIADVKANGNNANSKFATWGVLLVLVSFAFPIIGFYLMHREVEALVGDSKTDSKTVALMQGHFHYVKIAAIVGLLGALGLLLAVYKMYKVLFP